jgi:orotate phosphoribosyltransferase
MTTTPDTKPPTAAQAALETARLLLGIGAVHFRPESPFRLTSGWMSPVYVDCRKVISFPRERGRIIELAVAAIEREIGRHALDAIAGGETAGIPYGAWIADRLELPMLYVRKQPKGVGRMAQIEGDLAAGWRTLLVEDLATDGMSKLRFARALREAGAVVEHSFVVFHYGVFADGAAALEAAGVRLHALATWRDVLAAAEADGLFKAAVIAEVRSFLADPAGWSAAHGGIG